MEQILKSELQVKSAISIGVFDIIEQLDDGMVIIKADERILKDREMTVRLNELGASSINFVVRVWSNSSDLQNVYWDVLEKVKRSFDEHGISFPYPQMDVNFKRVKEAVKE